MSGKYPYLNSVIFENKVGFSDNVPNNKREPSVNNSLSSSDINCEDHFQDIDLNETEDDVSNFHNVLSWKVETDSMDSLQSDNIEVRSSNRSADDPGSTPIRDIMWASSISSLSSLTSANDVTLSSHTHINENVCNVNVKNVFQNKNETLPVINQSPSKNIISHFTKFIIRKKQANASPNTPLKSTTCLILNDRPSGLPAKLPEELRRHREQYSQLLNNIKIKEKQQYHDEKAKQKSKLNFEERQIELANTWRNFIIPNWPLQKTSKFVRHLWWEGIPTSLRDKVWKLCIPNTLRLTKVHYDNFLSQMNERIERYLEAQKTEEADSGTTDSGVHCRPKNGLRSHTTSESRSSAYDLYISETVSIHSQRSSTHSASALRGLSGNKDFATSTSSSSESEMRQTLLNTIKLDVSRTFPHLNLFQNGGPHYDLLYQLLGSYTCYRPDIGYVQGMSFLAAILILVMHVEDAFVTFANIIEMPCHHAFYGLDENEFSIYVESFKLLLHTHLPQLGQHFVNNRLDVNIFICDWLFTIYSRALSLDTALIVWDMFCRDGASALFRAGLGILRCYEMQLLNSDFEELASFLTGQMPESLTPTILVVEMKEIRLSKSKFKDTICEVRSRLIPGNKVCPS